MRLILAFLFILVGCASHRAPEVPPPVVIGKMASAKSRVQIFLADERDEKQKFYLILRDDKDQKIEIEESSLLITSKQGKVPKYKFERISKGRFQVLFNEKIPKVSHLKFSVQGIPLKKSIENRHKPEPIKGKIVLVSKGDHEVTLKLSLQNMRGESLETDGPPGTVIEGGGTLSELKRLQKGLWEIKVSLPEENVIIYVSIRTNGAHLDHLFRYQHIEN